MHERKCIINANSIKYSVQIGSKGEMDIAVEG